jgi:hypothetical protein
MLLYSLCYVFLGTNSHAKMIDCQEIYFTTVGSTRSVRCSLIEATDARLSSDPIFRYIRKQIVRTILPSPRAGPGGRVNPLSAARVDAAGRLRSPARGAIDCAAWYTGASTRGAGETSRPRDVAWLFPTMGRRNHHFAPFRAPGLQLTKIEDRRAEPTPMIAKPAGAWLSNRPDGRFQRVPGSALTHRRWAKPSDEEMRPSDQQAIERSVRPSRSAKPRTRTRPRTAQLSHAHWTRCTPPVLRP